MLWDAGKQSSVDDVIRLLKSHFGSSNEEEQYRSEVRSRQRRRGESLQSVYRDIRRIMALAFPGQSGSLWDCDAFVDALANRNLRYRILERDPSTLEEAFNVASGLEALSCSVGDTDPDVCWDESGRRRIRQSCSAAHVDDEIKLRQLIGELCEERRHTKEKMENLCRWQRQESEALRQSMEVEMAGLADRLKHLSLLDHQYKDRTDNTEAPNIFSTTATEVTRMAAVPTTNRRRQEDRCH